MPTGRRSYIHDMKESALFKLDTAKQARKAELETIIAKGIATFREVGEALAEVRAAKLYADEFETFEEYVREKWQIGQSRAYQIMGAAAIAKEVSTYVEIPNEAVARQLSKIPKVQRTAAAKELAKVKKITAPAARSVVQKVMARGGLAAMARTIAVEPQPEIDLNLKPRMTPVAKAQAIATINEWYEANRRRLNEHPAASPETVVRRIVSLFQ